MIKNLNLNLTYFNLFKGWVGAQTEERRGFFVKRAWAIFTKKCKTCGIIRTSLDFLGVREWVVQASVELGFDPVLVSRAWDQFKEEVI